MQSSNLNFHSKLLAWFSNLSNNPNLCSNLVVELLDVLFQYDSVIWSSTLSVLRSSPIFQLNLSELGT